MSKPKKCISCGRRRILNDDERCYRCADLNYEDARLQFEFHPVAIKRAGGQVDD